MPTPTQPDSVTVIYRTARGASMLKTFHAQADFEAEIMRLYAARTSCRALLNNDDDNLVASVEKQDGKWVWWFDSTALPSLVTLTT